MRGKAATSSDSGETVRAVTLPAGCAGKRADFALSSVLPQSRSRIAALIKSGDILMDGRKFKPSVIVGGGEKIQFRAPQPRGDSVVPENIPLDVIFEDDDLIVINKPAGMVIHPGAGRKSSTVANALAHRYPALSSVGGSLRPGIVHRLDKDTSGVVIAAKNDICHAALAAQFAGRSVKKEYHALVWGQMKGGSGVFSSAIGRSPSNRKKMSGKNPAKARESVTDWETVECFSDWTFVRISPKTGRTHQIRVHFSEAGHPVAADALYCGKPAKLRLASSGLSKILKRQALHASAIGFRHPSSGKDVSFRAPLAVDMADALDFLSGCG